MKKGARRRVGVASISERVMVRVRHMTMPEIMMEMELDEAKNMLRELNWHVYLVETGQSVMPDFHSFMHTLPTNPRLLK